MLKRNCFLLTLLACGFSVAAQENSPYSRYGLGDIYPSQQINMRGMGGLSAAYTGSINFSNPATYANIPRGNRNIAMDFGVLFDSRTLKNTSTAATFNSKYLVPSYFAFGTPISAKHGIGFAFGLTPVTRISYSINQNQRISGVDSLSRLYEGSGGLYKAFLGLSKKWHDKQNHNEFSIGANGGYLFGNKEINTRTIFLNDTVSYYKSLHQTKTSYGNLFAELGFQYNHLFKADTASITWKQKPSNLFVTIGGTTQLKTQLNASQDINRQTFDYDANSATFVIDTVSSVTDVKGKIQLPATYTAGIMFGRTVYGIVNNWAIGLEYTTTRWQDYRFYGQSDALINSHLFKIGGEFTPNAYSQDNGLALATYRAGFNFGKDYVNANGRELKTYNITVGATFPIKKHRGTYSNQSAAINTALEFGKRGSAVNSVTESYFRASIGFSLGDIWFRKVKYD
jgi:hypothetical protein